MFQHNIFARTLLRDAGEKEGIPTAVPGYMYSNKKLAESRLEERAVRRSRAPFWLALATS